MEDFSPNDIALDYGYYQGHSEALLWNDEKLPGWVLEWLDRRLLEAAAAE